MKNSQIQKNIPSTWTEKRLEQVLKVGSGKDYKHLSTGKIPVFGTGGYMLSVDNYLYSGETVFVGRKGTIDKPFYYKGKFWTVDTLFYTYDFKDTCAKYINYVFKKINWIVYNEASGVPSLSKTTIEKIKFLFPPLPEQKRIVKVLEVWDKATLKLEKKIEIKKNIKKGLMQRLLSGKKRLPGFSGAWKKVKL
ncbi:MAG: restriction endonuclease subunit S, partial [Patescibacteria group bacterium]|nr:restriction endonuclease subunit S [Patescibacteria group bacterium]